MEEPGATVYIGRFFDMNTFLIALILIQVAILLLMFRYIQKSFVKLELEMYKSLNSMADELTLLREDIEKTKVKTSPNKVKEEKDETVSLSEDSPWTVPPDVKIAVEGGDTNSPYEYGS